MAESNPSHGAVFAELRALYAAHEHRCVLLRDDPGAYYLGSHEVRARDGYRTAFGGVEIGKRYVSAHLMPVYIHPQLLADVSPALAARMQGKSCFNFTRPDPLMFAELGRLIDAGAAQFIRDGRL